MLSIFLLGIKSNVLVYFNRESVNKNFSRIRQNFYVRNTVKNMFVNIFTLIIYI